jgi:hypothetical protein
LARCLIAASTWKAATGCPEILQRQGPGLEVFPLLFEFGLAQEIIAATKTKEKNHTEAAIPFSHTQALHGIFSASVSFLHFSPESLFTTFGFLLPDWT